MQRGSVEREVQGESPLLFSSLRLELSGQVSLVPFGSIEILFSQAQSANKQIDMLLSYSVGTLKMLLQLDLNDCMILENMLLSNNCRAKRLSVSIQ